MEKNSTFKSLLLKSLFIIAIFILIAILAFGVIKIVPKMISSFASVGTLFSTNEEEIDEESGELEEENNQSEYTENTEEETQNNNLKSEPIKNTSTNKTKTAVTTTTTKTIFPADLVIGNVFLIDNSTISFTITNNGDQSTGSWYFTYLLLNKGYQYSPTQPSLLPNSGMLYTLRFNNNDSGVVTISVDPNNAVREISESNNTASIAINGSYSYNNNNYYNYDPDDRADLKVQDLRVGRISGSRFIEEDEIDDRDDAGVQFVVKNIGGEDTGSWRFEIQNAPYSSGDNEYKSSRQNSLRPGESRTLTVKFENPDEGRYSIRLVLDSEDDVREEKENNNTESESLRVID